MIDLICRMAEEQFGIKADPIDAKRLEDYIQNNCGKDSVRFLEKTFLSGTAAEFLTVNETYFFREPVHFSLLLDLLPSFENSVLRICSAATATGCEAYSIAMLIESYNKGKEKPVKYHIDAFDINPRAIETARLGIYNNHVFRDDGSCFRYMARLFLKETGNQYYIEDALKTNINFFVHNLMENLYTEKYDIIFFRNAFIYFLPHKREQLLSNLSLILKNCGILILGVSETAGVQHEHFVQQNRCAAPSFGEVFYFHKTAVNPVFTGLEPCKQ